MKWYHYTSIERLRHIIHDEFLLSHYEQLIAACAGNSERVSTLKRSAEHVKELDPDEYRRNANVFLTATPNQRCGAYSLDIRLQFELGNDANFGCHLALPKVSLEHLEEIVVSPGYLRDVKTSLKREHDGKYANIPVNTYDSVQL